MADNNDYHYLKWIYQQLNTDPIHSNLIMNMKERYKKETGERYPYDPLPILSVSDIIGIVLDWIDCGEPFTKLQEAILDDRISDDAIKEIKRCLELYYGKKSIEKGLDTDVWERMIPENRIVGEKYSYLPTLVMYALVWGNRIDIREQDGTTSLSGIEKIYDKYKRIYAIKPGHRYEIIYSYPLQSYVYKDSLSTTSYSDEDVEELVKQGYIFGHFEYTNSKEAEEAQSGRLW